MRERTDSELWEAARGGDSESFGVLYERHARAIYNYLFRRLSDWGEAEELTAVVFLEAYRRRREFALEEGKVLAWLYGVATNVLRNRRRALWRHRRALSQLPPPPPPPDFAADAVARLAAQHEMRAISGEIRRLPRAQQDVIALCLWSELTYEEAAACLGVSVGTVRSRLARARQALMELDPAERHERGTRRSEGVAKP
jgi:RNA polymerase sigma-70 factor (ECF subfamily)